MGKILIAILLLSICSLQAPKSLTADCGTCSEAEFRQFQRDIPSLYLINGLYLTKEQTLELVSILQKAKSIEDKAKKEIEKIEKKYQRDIDRDIEKVMKQVSDKGKVDQKTLKSLRSKQLGEAKHELGTVRWGRTKKLNALANEAYQILTPSQKSIVSSFKPCFIPSRDFRNPARVGQDTHDTSYGERILSRLRKVPEQKMDKVKKRVLDNMVRHVMYKRHIKYSKKASQKVREELSQCLEEVLPRALALSDVDFELQKSDLSKELVPIVEKERTHSQNQGVVRTYLLNTGNIEALQSRLKD